MGIPYQAIGIGIGFIIGIWAIIVAESPRGRLIIAAIMAAIFLLPVVWRHSIAHFIAFLAWIVFGISCYLFIKLRGVRIR
jgi:hypothetical protein